MTRLVDGGESLILMRFGTFSICMVACNFKVKNGILMQ